MEKIGVVFAMEREARATLSDPLYDWERCGADLWKSRKFPVSLVLSGVGKVFAAWALARIARDCDLVLSLGTSGGLGEDEAGGFFLASEFVEWDVDATGFGYARGVTPSSGMKGPVISSARPVNLERARVAAHAAGLSFREVRAASGDSFINDAAKAATIRAETGAEIVDMESAAIAKLCMLKAGKSGDSPLEYLAFRAVSDKADSDATISFEALVDRQSLGFAAFLRSLISSF
jgi:5'-methylthioadenosine/S-adenosylhomocysteine nucleosidase